jgi:NADH-quinone oxidoreductase subunit M
MLLLALLVVPLLAAAVTFFASGKDGDASFRLGLFLSLGIAALGLPLVTCAPHLSVSLPWFTLWGTGAEVKLSLVNDGLSGWLIQLVTWLTPVAILGSRAAVKERARDFIASVFVMQALMIGALLSRDLVVFYLCYEGMLVPMVVIICLFGGDDRRTSALWFFLYTMLGSIMMLVGIWYLAWKLQTTDLGAITAGVQSLPADVQFWLFWSFALAFAVKVPLVPLHGWQARTYAETPGAGVVLLAGAMAKIGGYGFLRFVLPIFPAQSAEFANIFIVLGLIATVGGALVAIAQDDAKRMLAYSSLSHLGLVMVGIFTFEQAALNGAAVQMVAHGLSIAALFLLVSYIENRSKTYGLDDFGGLITQTPVLGFLFVVAALASAALPGTMNFVGEFELLLGMYAANPWIAAIAGISVILGVVYLLILIQKWFFGKARSNETLVDLNAGEVLAVVPLLIASFVLGFYPAPVASQAGVVAENLGAAARAHVLAMTPATAAAPAAAAAAPAVETPAH